MGAPTGPGFVVHVQSDFIGPPPPDAQWLFTLLDSDLVNSACYSLTNSTERELLMTLGYDFTREQLGMYPAASSIQTGLNGVLRLQWTSPTSGPIDVTDMPVKIDMETGIPYLMQVQTQLQGQGGLTQQEHTWLDDTQAAVQRVFTDVTGAALSNPIGSLIAHPDLSFLDLCDGVMTLSGRGELTRPAPGVGVNAYGLAIGLNAVPPGFGVRDGSVVAYSERLAQLITMHAVKGGTQQWLTEELNLHLATMLWLWRNAFPARVLYDVTPGVELVAQWICARL